MSTTYSYTRNPFSPIPVWPAYIVMPSDGDPFIAQSAQIFEKTLQDRNMFVFESAIKASNSMSNIVAWTTGNKTIRINPFIVECLNLSTYKIVQYSTPTDIGEANLDPAGTFANNTWYYVYLQLNNDNTSQFIVTTDPPHVYLLYLDVVGVQDKSSKFFFAFRTDGTGNIFPFTKQGQRVMYTTPRNALNGGTAGVFTAVSLTSIIPPYARMVYINAELENGELMADNQLNIGDGLAQFFTIYVGREPLYPTLLQFNSHHLWVSVKPSTQEIFYQVGVPGANSKAYIDVIGYLE